MSSCFSRVRWIWQKREKWSEKVSCCVAVKLLREHIFLNQACFVMTVQDQKEQE